MSPVEPTLHPLNSLWEVRFGCVPWAFGHGAADDGHRERAGSQKQNEHTGFLLMRWASSPVACPTYTVTARQHRRQ